jgi:hypothetical protein
MMDDVGGFVGEGGESERDGEKEQGATAHEPCTRPYSGLYRGMWSRTGGDEMMSIPMIDARQKCGARTT